MNLSATELKAAICRNVVADRCVCVGHCYFICLQEEGSWPEMPYCCSLLSSHGAWLCDSVISHPVTHSTNTGSLVPAVYGIHMCVSGGLWWFWVVSSEHPCVYSHIKVSKKKTKKNLSALCSVSFHLHQSTHRSWVSWLIREWQHLNVCVHSHALSCTTGSPRVPALFQTSN